MGNRAHVPCEHGGVGIANLPRAGFLIGFYHFIAGRQNRRRRTRHDGNLRLPHGCEKAQPGWGLIDANEHQPGAGLRFWMSED
jgi:hypothetical protein